MRPEQQPEQAELDTASAELESRLDDIEAGLVDGEIQPAVAQARLKVVQEKRQLLKVREVAIWARLARRCLAEMLAEKGLTEDAAYRVVDRITTASHGSTDD